MRLTPSDPDIQTLIGRIKSNEIDLQPDFQRGEVWSTAKKQRLVDSVLRDWHIPPIHVIVDSESGQQLVLDGQQRLVAIRDFVDGVFVVDGRTEPRATEIENQHGRRYNQLPIELKRRFDQFTIRVFRITDYVPSEPGELFYRLNQPTALTAAEQRNAFFGETRKQIKGLVSSLLEAGLDNSFWGFTNARMAYDDIFSRAAVFLEQNSLKKKVTSGSLADRFRSGAPFSNDVIDALQRVVSLLSGAKKDVDIPISLNKATAQSWLIFWSVVDKALEYQTTPELIGRFMLSFETERFVHENGFTKESESSVRHRIALFRSYEDRSTSRVADVLSVQIRDFVLWSAFLEKEAFGAAKQLASHSEKLRLLRELLTRANAPEWSSIDSLVTSLNWGDPLWL